MPAKFSPAPEVAKIARHLIREHHWHLDADGVRIEGGAREIPTQNGPAVLVDAADYDFLSQWKWRLSNAGYVYRKTGTAPNIRTIIMHRLLADPPPGFEVDHINRDRLDNRRCNLRITSHSLNNHNKGLRSDNSSGHTGVCWHKARGKWRAELVLEGKRKHLGVFARLEDAVACYERAKAEGVARLEAQVAAAITEGTIHAC